MAESREQATDTQLAVINIDHLSSFTEGDDELEEELALLFVNSAGGYLKRMREAIDEERSWSAEAHALKGASANLGAERVAALAKDAEFSPPSLDDLERLKASVREVEAFFAERKG
jgi:HPt (histidine-containing phosphotransfer) domain-containing protein